MATGTIVMVKADGTAVRLSCDDTITGLGSIIGKNIPATGNASTTEVVIGSDTRLGFVSQAKWQDF